MQKTYSAKPGEVERRWFVVDVEGQVLGRVATEIAKILRGKHKPQFTRHTDTGDFVIAVNAEKIKLTGSKLEKKNYYQHSGYIGNLKAISAGEQLRRHPDRVLRAAVAGMLPKNTLGRNQLKKLKIYAGPEHPHEAQVPAPLKLATEKSKKTAPADKE
jgi:large subunit ribosomal protein L13